MKTNVPGKITDSLVHAGAVPSEDRALYEYGVRQGIVLVINVVTFVLIGLLMGMVWQSIIFMLAYNPIRSYAGGYHAGTPLTCYLLSIPTIFAVLSGVKFVSWNGYLFSIIILSAGIVIMLLAPVEDSHKPLNGREKEVYKGRARIYSLILAGAAIILWFLGMKQTSLSIVMALGVAAVMLILGAVKNRNLFEKKRRNDV